MTRIRRQRRETMKKAENEGRGIRCPKCGSPESLVYDSRKMKNFSVMRRRECKACGFRFTTEETLKEGKLKDN